MEQAKYIKDRKSGLVIDTTADYGKYLQEKNNAKSRAKAHQEIDAVKREVADLKGDLSEMKDMLRQLLGNKE